MTVTLKEVVGLLDEPKVSGDLSVSVLGVTHDSRKVKPGWLFFAFPGATTDGHRYIRDALNAGAVAIVAEKSSEGSVGTGAWIQVSNARKDLGKVAALVNGNPTMNLTLIGITGTSGKTTLTYLLEEIIKTSGGNPGVVGTVTYRWGGMEKPASRTTPEASDLQAVFEEMVLGGVTHAMIEASSHGLHLDRLDGCNFDLGVFTNLSQDHLDYHMDFERYYLAKRLLFERLLPRSPKKDVAAVVNLDDPYGRRLAQEIVGLPVIGFGASSKCDFHPVAVDLGAEGIVCTVSTPEGHLSVRSRLTGMFNVMNILAAMAVAFRLGISPRHVSEGIEAVQVVPGRLERIPSECGSVFVDYAHKPEALKNVLEALQRLRKGRIITIIGCGGDRDKTKRPVMGREAAAGSDVVVVTSDNPRSEDPCAIIRQVVKGVQELGYELVPPGHFHKRIGTGRYLIVPDRREAIAWAVGNLENGDILLVAGKGHETYQEIQGVRYPFDDREIVRQELLKRSKGEAAMAKISTCKKAAGRSETSGSYRP